MTFEIWDCASGNRLGLFDSKEQALELVREIEEGEGRDVAAALALGVEDGEGHPVGAPVAGATLLELAHGVTA